jgi:hypothetical protein
MDSNQGGDMTIGRHGGDNRIPIHHPAVLPSSCREWAVLLYGNAAMLNNTGDVTVTQDVERTVEE